MNEPTPITHRLRRAAGGSGFTLHHQHTIFRVEVYHRHYQGGFVDFALVRGHLTAHGNTLRQAFAVLREKRDLQQQLRSPNQ